MSFILDALKKAEEQRRQGGVPDLRAVPAGSSHHSRRAFWPALLAVALLVNALLLLLWWQPWRAPSPVAQAPLLPAPGVTSSVPAEEVAPVRVAGGKVPGSGPPPAPVGWSDLGGQPLQVAPKPVASAAGTKTARPGRGAATLPHLRDLPDSFRRALPDLGISLHYYDPDPASRMIRLNGRILREGSTIAEGLTVEEITATGVILNRQGERFRAGDF